MSTTMQSGELTTVAVPAYRKMYIWMAIPMLVGAFYVIDHSFYASTSIEEVTGVRFDGTENRTADRTSQVNADTGTARLVLAAFGLVGLSLPNSKRLRWSAMILWAIVLYMFWLCCTIFWSDSPAYSMQKLAVVFVFLVASAGVSRQMTLRQLGQTFALVCIAFICLGILAELSLGTFMAVNDYRFTGTCHPNTQAAYGSIACLGATLFTKKDGRFSSKACIIFGIGTICLLMTKSRTSLVAMAFGVIAMQGIRFRGRQRLVLVTGAIGALASATLVLSLVGGQMQSRMGTAAAMGRTDDISSLTGRLPLWEELVDTIGERPIVGHGYLAFWTPEQVEYLGDLFKWEVPHGHNMYLDVLIDCGMIGLLLFLLVFLVGAQTAARHFRLTGDAGATFVFGLICFALVHGIGESFFKQYSAPNFVLLTVVLRFAWLRVGERDDAGLGESPVESLDDSRPPRRRPVVVYGAS